MKWVSPERSEVILSAYVEIKMSNPIFFIENSNFLIAQLVTLNPWDLLK